MGTLSTDLTVPIIKRSIETLNDSLYDSEFDNIEPVISNQLNMYSVLKNSRNGNNEHVLYERIKSNEGLHTMGSYMTRSAGEIFSKLLSDLASGPIAVIENSHSISFYLRDIECYVDTDVRSRVQKKSFYNQF